MLRTVPHRAEHSSVPFPISLTSYFGVHNVKSRLARKIFQILKAYYEFPLTKFPGEYVNSYLVNVDGTDNQAERQNHHFERRVNPPRKGYEIWQLICV